MLLLLFTDCFDALDCVDVKEKNQLKEMHLKKSMIQLVDAPIPMLPKSYLKTVLH